MNFGEYLAPRELAPDGQFLTACGLELHLAAAGPPDGLPVLLVHGFGAWAFSWRKLSADLARAGRRVLAIDLIGYGASSRPAAPVYSTADHARVLLAALDVLGVERVDVVGHSFGGRVALQLALDAPARVRRLVTICPEAFTTARPPVGALTRLPLFGQLLARVSFAPPLVGPGLRMLSGDRSWVTPEVAAGYAAQFAVRGSAVGQVWQARSPKDGARPVPQHLAAITQPTLVLWGERDPVFSAADGARLAQIMPDARLVVYAGAGHLPHEEQPAAVDAAIEAFLAA